MELCNTWVQIVHFILRQFLSLWLKKEMGTFFITFPHYYDELNKEKELSDEIRKQGFFNEHQKLYYFRVTEQQYNELSENYEKSVNE